MRTKEWIVEIDAGADTPIFLQIARALADDVRRGRLKAGAPLPGSRALAASLDVNRNTVLAAYAELVSEGWVTTERARGTFVSTALPEARPRRFAKAAAQRDAVPARVGFDLGPVLAELTTPRFPRGTLHLAGGAPDVRLVPWPALARAYRRALRADSRAVLDYGDPRGHVALRRAISAMLADRRGLASSEDDVLITRGSQMAIHLVARALISPGDVVAIEALGYRPAWEALRLAGARLCPLPVDASGLRVDALADLAGRERVRAVYLTPHHQYPTTAVLAPGRRLELLEIARRERIAIIEDDYDHEFHYEGRPILPLASADRAGVVIYVGTLSKILAPGLRLGFVVAPEPLTSRMAALRALVDRQGDQALERAVAELVEDGEVARHARRARGVYRARRDALVHALSRDLGGVLSFSPPAGGLALWAEIAPSVDVDAWAERALALGVAFFPGRRFAFDGRARSSARFGFAALTEREIAEAVRRVRAALHPTRASKRTRASVKHALP